MLTATTLRPGLLVSLHTSLTGNVDYTSEVIESDHLTADGARLAKWETTRTVADPAEHEAGIKARSKARACITGVCAKSSFGLLCPSAAEDNLKRAIRDARDIVAKFNSNATLTQMQFNVMVGRVAADDVEAVRSINAEVRGLLAAMEAGVSKLDVEAIRDAANKARGLGQMLAPEAAVRIKIAIEAARSTAKKIAKAGETAAGEVDRVTLNTLAEARTAFLDLDDDATLDVSAVLEVGGRAIDYEPANTDGEEVNGMGAPLDGGPAPGFEVPAAAVSVLDW